MPSLYKIANPNTVKLEELILIEDDEQPDDPVLENEVNRSLAQRSWSLGPEQASIDPTANPEYWQDLAATWKVTEAEARRRLCANCEYFDNTPEAQEMMELVPLDEYDMNGGGRGICAKFDFICHSLRVCQAWEKKPFYKSHRDED